MTLSHAHGHIHICKYFQESISCLPSIPSRREGTASNCKRDAIAITVYTMQFILHRNAWKVKLLVLIKHTNWF